MELILDKTVKKLVDLLRAQFLVNTAVNTSADYYEAAELPAFVLDGFTLRRNNFYRTSLRQLKLKAASGPDSLVAYRRRSPLWYDLSFSGTLITNSQSQLLTGAERLVQFQERNHEILIDDPEDIEDVGLDFNMEDPTLVSNWPSNRSDVQSIKTRFTLSALPIYDGYTEEVKLILTREFIFKHLHGRHSEEILIITHTP